MGVKGDRVRLVLFNETAARTIPIIQLMKQHLSAALGIGFV